ncbi:MAG: tRNA 2-thiocytidine biosynthesis TtcA family protein [Spirochaetales bacterium]
MTGIEKAIAKAIHDYHLIEKGDRILIGASGGKDSTTLSWALARRKRWGTPPFELKALRIRTDVPGGGMPLEAEKALEALYTEWDLPLETRDVPVIGRLKPGKQMNCYWCATQRRTELMHYALEHGYNKIALGHHLDDILTTFLMNMVNKGELSTMVPLLKYKKFPVTVIRPLALVPEESIRRFAAAQGWLSVTCSCSYGAEGERKEFQRRLDILTSSDLDAKLRMFYALGKPNLEYLPGI